MQACYACVVGEQAPREVYDSLLRDDVDEVRANAKKNDELEDLANFYSKLFFGAMERRGLYEDTYIRPELEKWELERVALVDRILVMMGLEEFLHFPTIPIKVTINEYIEIAKDFSTEKSGIFVNGLLDKLYMRLDREGVIRKEGRGLVGQIEAPAAKKSEKSARPTKRPRISGANPADTPDEDLNG